MNHLCHSSLLARTLVIEILQSFFNAYQDCEVKLANVPFFASTKVRYFGRKECAFGSVQGIRGSWLKTLRWKSKDYVLSSKCHRAENESFCELLSLCVLEITFLSLKSVQSDELNAVHEVYSKQSKRLPYSIIH